MLLRIVTYLFALFVAVGCNTNDDGGVASPSGKYGTLQFGEEQVPVNTVKISDSENWLLVVLSPLKNTTTLTTNAIIGLKKELLGEEINVERYYCNDDYIVVYEDPQCYYAPFRPLKSGKILMRQSGESIGVEVDVVLYDGTPLRYTCWGLPK